MFVDIQEADAPWFDSLNAAQRAAVEHDDGHLLIVAGAGTGKTKTLATRVASLVETGADPDRILLLTFTRRAAAEMLDRVGAMTDRRWASQIWGGTFHAVANRLLRANAEAVGLSPSFTVLDPGDTSDLVGLVRAELHELTKVRRFPRADTIAAMHSRMVNSQEKLTAVVEDHFPWCIEHIEPLKLVLREYVARKRAERVLDFDDLLLHWRALCAAPSVGAAVRSRFDHVLVDEYQDTNALQADIVRSFSDEAVITVVGDDAQAIYGFRASTVHNLHQFPDVVGGAETVTLEQNYRSTNPILGVANAVLAQSDRHLDKMLWSDRTGGLSPRLVTCADEGAQSTWIAERILELREEGVPLTEQVVLFRVGHHSDHLELELARRDIPFVKYGGLKFLEAAHVKDVMALLRVLDNPGDQLAWSRVLRALPGVGPATVARVLGELGVAGGDPDAALSRFLDGDVHLPVSAHDDAELLRCAWQDCVDLAGTPDGGPAVEIDRLRLYCQAIFAHQYSDAAARLADLDQLAVTATSYSERSRFLTELVLDPPERTGDHAIEPHLDDEYVTISTIHSAKGGEWRAVTVGHAADGNLPSDMALGDVDGLEEERRLLYVALTRAKEHLAVTYPLRYHIHRYGSGDRHHFAQLSRFLEPVRDLFDESSTDVTPEADDAFVERVDLTDEVDLLVDGLLD